jgi:hypothetical protein
LPTIKKEEFAEAYDVIYEDVPAWFTADDLAKHPNNQLIAALLAQEKVEGEGILEDDGSFVVDLEVPARICKM